MAINTFQILKCLLPIHTVWLNIMSKTREWGIYFFIFFSITNQAGTYFISHDVFKTHFSGIQPWHKSNFLLEKYMDWNLIDNRYSCILLLVCARVRQPSALKRFSLIFKYYFCVECLMYWKHKLSSCRMNVPAGHT